MGKSVMIVFTDDAQMEDNESVKGYVENSKGDVTTVFIDGSLYAVIKKIDAAGQSSERVRMIAGTLAHMLRELQVENAVINGNKLIEAFHTLSAETVVTAFTEGWQLGSYQFVTYHSKESLFQTTLQISGNNEKIQSFAASGTIRAEATAFSRDLMNEPAAALNPTTFPSILKEEFAGTDVKVSVYDKDEIEKREMNGVLTVCRGSKHPPAFAELVYQGDSSKPLVALVGKGVTFDTGGISLKRGKDLSNMRFDMGGAAAVAGAMKLLANAKANVNVVALIPIVENIPDRNAVIPGDVIQYKNGLNVQVGNTDAEGRLILADGLIRAGELNAEYVVDIATLTGSIVNALGTKIAGVFGDEKLADDMKYIGRENGDFIWPMPLIDAYDRYLASDYADFNNTSQKAEAGSIVAALFLRRFVPEASKWLHVDMAGTMESEANGYYTKAATGYGARLLADFTTHVSQGQ